MGPFVLTRVVCAPTTSVGHSDERWPNGRDTVDVWSLVLGTGADRRLPPRLCYRRRGRVGLIILDLAHPLNLQFVGNLRFIPIPTLTLYWYRDPHPHLAVHHQRERRGSEKERKREKDRGRE
ncbi:hypothetical protein GW17_00023697 [Ensete ventricosum]|nr:hypothetical protein GW17_00023697 [Ensete ventricosum]